MNFICAYVGGVFISISALIMLYDVICRYFFNAPSLYAPFIVAFLTLGALFFGIGYSLQAGGQVHIETLVDKLPPLIRKVCFSLGYCFTLFFVFFMIRATFRMADRAFTLGWVTVGNVLMPMGILYSVMTIGYALLILAAISKLIQLWIPKKDVPKEVSK